MNEILANLALIHANKWCKAAEIDYSGSHLVKVPRKFKYQLVKSDTGEVLIAVTFHKHQVPTFGF